MLQTYELPSFTKNKNIRYLKEAIKKKIGVRLSNDFEIVSLDWLWSNTYEIGTGCWIWTGQLSEHGNPVYRIGEMKKAARVHRLVANAFQKVGLNRTGSVKQYCGCGLCVYPNHFSIIK